MTMEEHVFDRAVEQAIVSIKKGSYLLKCGSRGKPKLFPFRLSLDDRNLIWCSGKQEKHLRLSGIIKIVQGQSHFHKQNQTEKECHSFSLIYANGEHSLDLICKDKAQATTWFVGLKAVISRCQQPKAFTSLTSCKGVQTCVSSPARKKNLGLLDDTSQSTQIQTPDMTSTLARPSLTLSESLSYTSDNFNSSASSLSSIHGITDNSVPGSPYINPDIHSLIKTSHFKKDLSSHRSIMAPTSPRVGNNSSNVLKDVMIWGGGLGCIVGIENERFVQNSNYSLVPKLLESTAMFDVQNVALGGKHAAIVTEQGEVFCWGQGKWGRLGQRFDMDTSSPKIVDSLSDIRVKNVACGEYHTCALTDSGEVYAWGNDVSCSGLVDEGRIRSQWLTHKLSLPVEGISISSVACGEWHTAMVSSCGRLFTYGDGTFGVLGHGNHRSISTPTEVQYLKGLCVRSVSCGTWHTAAIVEVIADRFKYNTSSTGKLFTWGDGDEGRLGHSDNGNKLVPTCVSQLVDHDFVQVSCGRTMTLGLTSMGKVFAMGSSNFGQLGNPDVKDRAVMVEGMLKQEHVKKISCGSYHVAVLTSSGSVYTWGKGENGQLGLGDTQNRYTPCFVEALRDRQVDTITCGPSFTVAICSHKPISISDQSSCSGCRLPFGFTRKKHNCYNCGLLLCGACSSKKVMNASLAPVKSKAFRVCDSCFDTKQASGSTHSIMNSSKSRNCNYRHLQNQKEIQQNLEDSSSKLGSVPQCGQVSRSAQFRSNCTENSAMHDSSTKKRIATVSPLNVESTDTIKIDKSWSVAKKAAAKCKAAKEFIKALASRVHILSEKDSHGLERKAGLQELLPNVTPIHTYKNTPRNTNMDSVSNSSVVFSSVLRSKFGRSMPLKNDKLMDNNTNLTIAESQQDVTPNILKGELVEEYENDVYITLTTSPSGEKVLKRVRFSLKRFAQKEAERWWEENQAKVFDKYGIEGYQK